MSFFPRFSPLLKQTTASSSNCLLRSSPPIQLHNTIRRISITTARMSAENGKPLDPYKTANEDNLNVSIKDKIEDLTKFIDEIKFAMMTTRQTDNDSLVSRCMALAARENGIDLIFHTNTETGKVNELEVQPHVNVSFLKSSTGDWASLSGVASILHDREAVHKYYSAHLKAWVGDLGDKVHNGGPDDPRIGIIKVKVNTATYSLQKGNMISRGIEVAKSTVTGSPAHVNKLRELTHDEIETYRRSQNMVA